MYFVAPVSIIGLKGREQMKMGITAQETDSDVYKPNISTIQMQGDQCLLTVFPFYYNGRTNAMKKDVNRSMR